MMARQRWDRFSQVLLLGTATTATGAGTRVLNTRLKGLNRPATNNAMNVISRDMLLKTAGKIPRTQERGPGIGYRGRKERSGRRTDPTWKSSYKLGRKIVSIVIPMVGSP